VKQPVLTKLYSLKCNKELALKDADGRAVKKIIAAGIIDPVLETIMSLYASVYKVCSHLFVRIPLNILDLLSYFFDIPCAPAQTVDPSADISLLALPSSKIDTSNRLQSNEAFKVVIGDEVYQHAWVKEDRDKVLREGHPIAKDWDEIHPANGADTSLVIPWFSFGVHFVYSIPGRPADKDLVLTPGTLKKILNGQASNWTDADILIENPWISSLPAANTAILVTSTVDE
jgi:hypothetical protein